MTSAAHGTPRPPKMATWWVELFTTSREADGVLGDLAEEFQAAIASDGEPAARRRYRRDAWRTIRDLAFAPWQRPGSSGFTAAAAFAGFGLGLVALGLTFPMRWALEAVAGELVVRYPIYWYFPAAWFWQSVYLLGPMTTGIVVALLAQAAGLRAMSVAVSTIAAMAVVFAVDVPITLWWYGPNPRFPVTFTFLLTRWILGAGLYGGMFWVGAMIGRTLRWPTATTRSV